MSTSFQQQQGDQNLNFSKSAPTPQHGGKGDKEVLKKPPRRTWEPKLGPH